MEFLKRARLNGIQPEMVVALIVANEVYKDLGAAGIIVTSVIDGKHNPRSRHYMGCAVDIRVWNIPADARADAANTIRERLTPDYYVQLEPDHIHISWTPGQLTKRG